MNYSYQVFYKAVLINFLIIVIFFTLFSCSHIQQFNGERTIATEDSCNYIIKTFLQDNVSSSIPSPLDRSEQIQKLNSGFKKFADDISPSLHQVIFGVPKVNSKNPQKEFFTNRIFENLKLSKEKIHDSYQRPQRLPGGLAIFNGNLYLDSFFKKTHRKEINLISKKNLIELDFQPWIEIDPITFQWIYHSHGAGEKIRKGLAEKIKIYRGAGQEEAKLFKALIAFIEDNEKSEISSLLLQLETTWQRSFQKQIHLLDKLKSEDILKRQQLAQDILDIISENYGGIFTTPDKTVAQRWAHKNGGALLEYEINLNDLADNGDLYVGFEGGQIELAFISSTARWILLQGMK